MSARQPSMDQFHLGRIIFSLLTFGLLVLGGCAQHHPSQEQFLQISPQSAAELPPTTPFLRIETGMHTAPINRIDVDARVRYLVTASDDKTARVWDLASGRLLQVLRPPMGPGHKGKLYAVAISPDGETVAVGGLELPSLAKIAIPASCFSGLHSLCQATSPHPPPFAPSE